MLGIRAGLGTIALLIGSAAMTAAAPAIADPEFKLRGRLHIDAAYHDEDQIPLSDGFNARRARLGVSGTLDDNWSGIIEYDFAENNTSAQSVMLSRKLGEGLLKIGQFKVPMGLNELTSSNDYTFIERSSPGNSIVDSYRMGVGYDYFSGPLAIQTMVFGRRMGDDKPDDGGDQPLGMGGRIAYAPTVDGGLFHMGASFAYEDLRDLATRRYRDRPEARVDGSRLIDTGTITDASSTTKFGLELAFQQGPFSAEAEYLSVDVSRDGSEDPSFSGYHVQASYVLTGEKRGYRNGVFRGITPGASGRGAWEVAARYSSVDLIDAGFQGGEQDNITLALNYYYSASIRFMANYIMVDVNNSGATVSDQVVGDEDPNILIARAQFFF